VTLALEGVSPSGHPSTGNHGRDKPAVTRWLRLWGFESLPVHALGNGLAGPRPKQANSVRLRAGALLSRISLAWEAVCKTAVAGFDSPARLWRPEANRI
jgi:hypothetical protein